MKTVCEHCGTVAAEGELFCRACGAMLPVRDLNGGAAAIRQGRVRSASRPSYGSEQAAAEAPLETLDDADRAVHALMGRQSIKVNPPRKRTGVNWALLFTVLLTLVIFSVAGGYIYLRATPGGQKILARLGYEADTTAMWDIGAEYMDQGYIERAIAIEEDAFQREPNRADIYERLQQLCEAYEMAERPADAERVYTIMYQQVDKTNPVAYQNILRLMRAQDRLMEAAEFLKVAYTNTGLSSFETERLELIPAAPVTREDAAAGRYKKDVSVELFSEQGNDIYYALEDNNKKTDKEKTLPEDGELYTGPIHLQEGGWTLRAVCVSTDLVSDELVAKYVVTYPAPDAPKASLAPGTYQQRQRLRLRLPQNDPSIRIYYTIDSTPPNLNSPIYTEEGILLPGGRVVCRAVAVKDYTKDIYKVSNEMSVELQINNVHFENYYFNDNASRNSDYIDGAQIMKTTQEQFIRKYGNPETNVRITDDALPGTCYSLAYPWGEARFYVAEKGTLLYYLSTNASVSAPRNTKVGMTESQITEKYKDMGQAANQDGSRSLYYDSTQKCYGKTTSPETDQEKAEREKKEYEEAVKRDPSLESILEKPLSDAEIAKLDNEIKKNEIVYWYVDKQYEATVILRYYMENGVCKRITNSFYVN